MRKINEVTKIVKNKPEASQSNLNGRRTSRPQITLKEESSDAQASLASKYYKPSVTRIPNIA